jgi:hypothetical protein
VNEEVELLEKAKRAVASGTVGRHGGRACRSGVSIVAGKEIILRRAQYE